MYYSIKMISVNNWSGLCDEGEAMQRHERIILTRIIIAYK